MGKGILVPCFVYDFFSLHREGREASLTLQIKQCHVVHEQLNSCNSLPNYFLYEGKRHHFKKAIINFWHVQKASGSTVESCISKMYDDLKLPSPLHCNASCASKLDILGYEKKFKNMTFNPVLQGHGNIGLCDFIHSYISDRKCSTFAIFREPYERVVSHYYYIRQAVKNSPNRSSNKAVILPITEWVKTFGSIMWRTFSNTFQIIDENGVRSCKHSIIIEKKLLPQLFQNDSFTEGIVNNLDKLLSFVGLSEDLPTTFEMLEKVYNLPFPAVCSDMHVLKGTYEELNATEMQQLRADAKLSLMADEDVQRIMEIDVKLYEKAKEIFDSQKKIFKALHNINKA